MELYDICEISTMPGTLSTSYLENLDIPTVLFLGYVCLCTL